MKTYRQLIRTWGMAAVVATFFIAGARSDAAVLAYEYFDYPDGNLNDVSGGFGFFNAWSVTGNGTVTVDDGSIQVTPTNTGNTYAVRTLSTAVSDVAGTEVFIAIQAARTTGLRFIGMELWNDSTNTGFFGINSGQTDWGFNAYGSLVSNNGGLAVVQGEPDLLVLHIQFQATGPGTADMIRLYVNPGETLPVTPNLVHSDNANNGFNRIQLGAGFNNVTHATAEAVFDNIRIATTWAEVMAVPEPGRALLLTAGLMVISQLRRRQI